MIGDEIFAVTDSDGDSFSIDHADTRYGSQLFVFCEQYDGVLLTPKAVKKLRKALKQWLIDNGHKEAA